MEDDDARVGGAGRRLPEIEREERHTALLVGHRKIGRPVGQDAEVFRGLGQIFLLVTVTAARTFKVGDEIAEHLGVGADIEAVDRGIADLAARTLEIAHDVEGGRQFEEHVQVSHDDQVQI